MLCGKPSIIGNQSTERGAVAAVTTLMLTAMLGLSAVVIDVGFAWEQRRQLVTASDAGALAAAQQYVQGNNGCAAGGDAVDFVTRNHPTAGMSECTRSLGSGGAPHRVRVGAQATVTYFFGSAIGLGSSTVNSTTTVSYQAATTVDGGLRPMGLCLEVLDDLTPTMVPGNGIRYVIYYGKDAQPDACGGNSVPGNWGILDFDGGSNQQQDIKDWVMDGYDGSVSIGDVIEGDTGAFSPSLATELQHLVDNVDQFTLPVFNLAVNPGANADFTIDNFIVVKLHDFRVTGAQEDRYLDLEFLSEVVQGGGDGGDPDELGAFVIGICAVDGIDEVQACS